MNIDELALKVRNKTGFPIFEEDIPKFARALITEYEKAAGGEPFWYAVVSDKAPVVNKALRSLEVAEEYAAKSSDAYPGVHVVPLYPRPDPRVAELEAHLAEEESASRYISKKFEELEKQNVALLVAIEAKDAVLNTCLEMFDPEFGSSHLNIRLTVKDIKMAISPSTELLEARDRVRDAKLLQLVASNSGLRFAEERAVRSVAADRESGEWQPLLDGD